jgi:hypothetical protein
LPSDSSIYDYFSSYIAYEFGDEEYEKETIEDTTQNKMKFIGHR